MDSDFNRKRQASPNDDSDRKRQATEGEGEVDPLDVYMAGVEQEVKEQEQQPRVVRIQTQEACDEAMDPVADYLEARKEKGMSSALLAAMKTGTRDDSDEEVYAAAKAADQTLEAEYDSDDQLIITKREIDAIPELDHDRVEYEEFDKDFYEPCAEIKKKTKQEVTALREKHGIKAGGFQVPSPVESFFQCGFDMPLLSTIKKQNYDHPTPIQMQTLPVALSGRDVVGLAKTGSGKTAAYLLPMCIHVMAAPALKKGEGPLALIMAPTRELSEQIHKQARIFAKPYQISVTACFGGLRKYDQIKALKAGSDVAVATPGRMVDLIKAKACTMIKTTFVVLDEADRMFEMGLEKQVRSVMGQIRPDRQTLLFSATMSRRIERLSSDVLTNPIRISIGRIGAVNADIHQSVCVLPTDAHKQLWLTERLSSFVDAGDVLIFANQKQRVEDIAERLVQSGFRTAGIHGDMDQHTRMQIMTQFRNGIYHVLVATDVAARGLDIPTIKTVINFDCSKDADGHTHRVGRTGRAGDTEGCAHTLITPNESRQAAYLVNSLTATGQDIDEAVYAVASKDKRFSKRGKGRKAIGRRGVGRVGGSGLGFGEGASDSQPVPSEFAPSHKAMESEWASTMGRQTEVSTFLAPSMDTLARDYQTTSFKSSFVSSGMQGGDEKQKATIIAPKRSTKTSIPPPPVPVTQRPLRPPKPHMTRSMMPRQRQTFQSNSQSTGTEFQKAFAAAQEIAARFGGTVSKGHDAKPSTDR